MSDGKLWAPLRTLWQHYVSEPVSAPIEATFASLAADPVLACARNRIGDAGDADNPVVTELAARVVAAGQE